MESNQGSTINSSNKDYYLNPENVFPKDISDSTFDTYEQAIKDVKDLKLNYAFENEIEDADLAHKQVINESIDPKYNYSFAKGLDGTNPSAFEETIKDSKNPGYNFDFAKKVSERNKKYESLDDLENLFEKLKARHAELESSIAEANINSEIVNQLLKNQNLKIETIMKLFNEVRKIEKETQTVRELEALNRDLDELQENLNRDYFSNGIQL